MWRLIAGFLLFYLLNLVGGAIMEGSGGVQSTRLTQPLTAAGTTIYVSNTQGFLKSDYVTIGNEDVRYINKTGTTLTVAASGRGYNTTSAVAHTRGSFVYNSSGSMWNYILGFNLAATDTNAGGINLAVAAWNFLNKSVPKLMLWDFPQFMINEWTLLLRWILVCFSAGFTIYIVYEIMSSMGGVSQQVLTRF